MKSLRGIFKLRPEKEHDVHSVLRDAYDWSANCHLTIDPESDSPREVDTTLVKVKDDMDLLLLELSPNTPPRKAWVKQLVKCQLSYRAGKEPAPRVYDFESRVLAVEVTRKGRRIVVIKVPESLTVVRHRRNYRLGVNEAIMPTIYAWRTRYHGKPPQIDPNNMGHTLFQVDSDGPNVVMVHNISAGGFRLSLRKDRAKAAYEYLEKGAHLVMWVSIPEFDTSLSHQYMVLARVVRSDKKPDDRRNIGIHFLLLGGRSTKSGKLIWRDISESGIEELAHWVTRRAAEKRSLV